MRLAVGLIYIWFGLLKCFPQVSPAESIAADTIEWLTFGITDGIIATKILGVVEIGIGLGFCLKKLYYIVPIMYLQMAGTIIPLFAFPEKTWTYFPIAPTLLGQYILKNLVVIAAGIILGAVSSGAKLITDSVVANKARKAEKLREADTTTAKRE